jgi:hypothetical protein
VFYILVIFLPVALFEIVFGIVRVLFDLEFDLFGIDYYYYYYECFNDEVFDFDK